MDYMAMSGEGPFFLEGHGTPGFPSPPRKQAIFNDLAENPFVLSAGDIDGDSDSRLVDGAIQSALSRRSNANAFR